MKDMKKRLLWALLPLLLAACHKEPGEGEKPLYPTVGAINARYSVGDAVTVVFAKGNLQYQASTRTWRFADNQYDVLGISNASADSLYAGWIDLFGWGTSGFNGLMPYTVDDTNSHYAIGEFDIARTDYDWGRFNAISNAGNRPGQWRTLSYEEWEYLFFYRKLATGKRALASIEEVGVNGSAMGGIILLPDKWELPEGCTFVPGNEYGFATNCYNITQWYKMENAGAVFLPAGGYRDSLDVSLVGEYGCYWTASYYTDETAYELYLLNSQYAFGTAARANGHSVRLVQEK